MLQNKFNLDALVKSQVKQRSREDLRNLLQDRAHYLMLDKNESSSPMPTTLFEQFKQTLTPEMLCHYPILNPLYEKIARLVGVNANQVYLATGSDLAIKAFFDAFIEKGDHIIFHSPAYFMFENYAQYAGATISRIPVCKSSWEPNIEEMLNCINSQTKLMVLEDPSGFLGTRLKLSQVITLAEILYKKNILLLIDEAYLYVENTKSCYLDIMKRYPNIILSHTLSKAHALAGARIGYLVASSELIELVSRVRPLYEISALTAWAAEWQLDHPELLKQYQEEIKLCKVYLEKELALNKIKYRQTHGNFILIKFNLNQNKNIEDLFKQEGILIRRSFDQSELQGWFRVTITNLMECKQFVLAFKKILKDQAVLNLNYEEKV